MIKCSFVIIVILTSVFSLVKAQDREIKFEKISVGQGLSYSSVFDIVQDSLGYLWFATYDGQVNRYDGYEFKSFRPDQHDTQTVPYQNIRRLLVDHNGYLWMGGSKGIVRYDYKKEAFRTFFIFPETEDAYVTGMINDEANHIWVSTSGGKLFHYDPASEMFIKVGFRSDDNVISSIESIKSKGDLIYLGTRSGLYVFNKKNLAVRKITYSPTDHFIRDIELDPARGIWLGTEDDGLFLLGHDYRLINQYINAGGGNGLVNNKIRDIEVGGDGKIWIGTFKGLSILNPTNEHFDNYTEESGDNYSLSQNSVRCIFIDKDRGVWVGTYYGGISYYHPDNIKFNLINKTSGEPRLNDNVVNVIREDHKKNLWIGTNDHGLNYLNVSTRQITYFENKEIDRGILSSNNIKSLLVLEDETLLAGTHFGGLSHFNPKTGRSVIYRSSSEYDALADDRVTSLIKDSSGKVWVGTFKGLQVFDPRSGKFSPHYFDSKGQRLSSNLVSCLWEDSKKRIWIGTSNGLNVLHTLTNTFEVFYNNPDDSTSLSFNEITCLFEDSKKRIWVGTDNGLNLFDEVSHSFKRLKSSSGLSNNYIAGILEDDAQNLWVSTSRGLMQFNPERGVSIPYSIQDGLQSTQYNPNAAWKTTDGVMIFGGINGLTIFNPSKINPTKINPRVLFTGLLVNNKVVSVNDNSGILEQPISETKSIKLRSTQSMFSLQFAAINFYNQEKVNYLYKLEGYSDDWIALNGARSVSFVNLNPGEYIFSIKVNSPDNGIDGAVTSLKVSVYPPWWRSNLAYLLYFITVAGLVVLFYKIVNERITTFNALKVERLEKQKLEEIHKMKLQFFTNISHEFKTPLSLIISPLEKMMESKTSNDWYNKQIEVVYKNARRLLSLIDQLLEFRRAESGKMELNVCKDNLVPFLTDIYESFTSLAKTRDIAYTFEKKENEIEGYFDKSFLEKIMFNLLSNAFKYTPTSGSVILKLEKKQAEVVISVADSGRGIPSENLPYIFDLFSTLKEKNPVGGSGIGLAFTKRLVELHHGKIELESEPGKGAAFTITLPVTKDAYLFSEISEEPSLVDDIKKEITLISAEAEFAENDMDSKGSGTGESILIVDDSQDLINYLYENLSSAYTVDVAYDGLDALEKIHHNSYDLVISDVMMPNMDGLTLCKKIKQNIKTCHIPVILLTVKASVDQQVEGLNTGADEYLGKPFSLRVLESKISNLIKSRKRLKEVYNEGLEVHPEQVAYNALDQEFLKKAVAIIEENLSDSEFSVDMFAKQMYMSRSNLHLKFKAITGDSASDFIKKIRFRKAVELLQSGKYNISEISYMVGFSSPSYFSNRFRQYFGCLPTDYMKKK